MPIKIHIDGVLHEHLEIIQEARATASVVAPPPPPPPGAGVFSFTLRFAADQSLSGPFEFITDAVADLPTAPGFAGQHKWVFTDAPEAGDTAYAFLQHEDPLTQQPFTDAIRFFLQSHPMNAATVVVAGATIPSNPGTMPYAAEDATVPIDRSMPGATFDFIRQRHSADNFEWDGKTRQQYIAALEIPAIDPVNSKVKWYYQLGGRVVAEHDDFGQVAHIVLSSEHERYAVVERRVGEDQ